MQAQMLYPFYQQPMPFLALPGQAQVAANQAGNQVLDQSVVQSMPSAASPSLAVALAAPGVSPAQLPGAPMPGATQTAIPAPKSSKEIPGVTDSRFVGQIVQYNEEKGFGFIHCPELQPIFQKDIFLHRHQVAGFIVGENVSFGVFLSRSGQAQAKDLSVPMPAKPAPASAGEVPGVTDRRFMGTIVAYNQDKGFGFISNAELKAIFGKDVFLHKEQVGSFSVGSQVAFGVFLNKQGQAQAKDLSEASMVTQGQKRPASSVPALMDMPPTSRPRVGIDTAVIAAPD